MEQFAILVYAVVLWWQEGTPMDDDLMSVTDVARMLDVTPHAVRALIARGVLPARKLSTVWIVRLADVRTYQQRIAGKQRPGRKRGAA